MSRRIIPRGKKKKTGVLATAFKQNEEIPDINVVKGTWPQEVLVKLLPKQRVIKKLQESH